MAKRTESPADRPELVKTNVYLPKPFLEAAHRAAAQARLDTGEQVSMADIVRWGMFLQLCRLRDGETPEPEDYPYNHGKGQ